MPVPARPATVVVMLAVALLLAGCAEDAAMETATPSPSHVPSASAPTVTPSFPVPESGFYGMVRSPAVPAEAFTLTDQAGEPFRFPRDADGEVVLVYFGYTHCPDICPGTLAGIAVALRDLPSSVREAVDVVFVTVDPERDTPEVLGDYVGLFSEDFVGLSGSERDVQEILAGLGLPPATRYDLGGGQYGVGHPAGVLAFTPDDLAHLEYPFGVTVGMWQHDLEKLVRDGWEDG